MTPTPEEKCEHDWNLVEYRSGIYRECSKCCKEELMNSPSPEARVDWELKVRKILSRFLKRASDPSYDEKHQFDVAIRDLSAAFEKGREAR